MRLAENVFLLYPKQEEETAQLLVGAVERAMSVIRETWGLPCRARCNVYILGSPILCILHSRPWYLLPAVLLCLPVWARRVLKMRRVAAAFTLRHRIPAVFIETPTQLASKDRAIGKQIFAVEMDLPTKVRAAFSHELTHAFSARLKLPLWLNEGIAMLTVDRFLGTETVRRSTLTKFRKRAGRGTHDYRTLHKASQTEFAYSYSRGYWITRYLVENYPGLVESLLERKHGRRKLERGIARGLDMTRRGFWRNIDGLVFDYFEGRME